MIKRLAKRALSAAGYSVTKTRSVRQFSAEYLRELGRPTVVVDVGVGYGTPELYRAFPHAHFYLIEPLADYRDAIDAIRARYDCTVHYKAVGNVEGKRAIWVDTEDLQKSSFEERSTLTATGHELAARNVQVTTLDALLRTDARMGTAGALLKIDAEGHEYEILEGATTVLPTVDTVIVELSVARRFENRRSFEDVVALMSKNGFRVFDFVTLHLLEGGVGIKYVDVVFKKSVDPNDHSVG